MTNKKKKVTRPKPKTNRTFKFKDNKYTVLQPNNKIRRESDAVYTKAYREAIQSGFFLEAEVKDILKTRGFDEKSSQKRKNDTLRDIRKLEAQLAKKQYDSAEEGRDIAIDIKELRETYENVDSAKSELTSQCAATIAENKRLSFFAYACVIDSDGDRIWDSFEDFEVDESELAYEAASEVLSEMYDTNRMILKTIESQKSENKWLIDNSLMDDDFHYLNDKGQRIDTEGRLIDENMNFIDNEGNRLDIFGNYIDEDGNILPKKPAKKTVKKPVKKEADETEAPVGDSSEETAEPITEA